MQHFQILCVLSVAAVLQAGGVPNHEERNKALIEECKKKTKASTDDVKSLDEEFVPTTRTRLCLSACYYKGTGVMESDNKINLNKAVEEFEDVKKENKEVYEMLMKVMKTCNEKYKPVEDECESVKIFSECILKTSKDMGLPVEK